VVTYLKEEATRQHYAHLNARRNDLKYFWEVKKKDVDKTNLYDNQTVHGNRKAHLIDLFHVKI
jgi:hypothetical protein